MLNNPNHPMLTRSSSIASALHHVRPPPRRLHSAKAFAGLRLDSAWKLEKIMDDNKTNPPYLHYDEVLVLCGRSPTINLMDIRVVLEMIQLK